MPRFAMRGLTLAWPTVTALGLYHIVQEIKDTIATDFVQTVAKNQVAKRSPVVVWEKRGCHIGAASQWTRSSFYRGLQVSENE